MKYVKAIDRILQNGCKYLLLCTAVVTAVVVYLCSVDLNIQVSYGLDKTKIAR